MMNGDGTFQEDIQCIIDPIGGRGGLYISNLEAASNPITLQRLSIGAVISAVSGHNIAAIIPRSIEYLYLPAIDHESFDISVYFKDSFDMIEEEIKRTNVLVHCMAGVSRSATLVIAYIMRKYMAPFEKAYQLVKNRRKIIHPNSAFVKQLKNYEKEVCQLKENCSRNINGGSKNGGSTNGGSKEGFSSLAETRVSSAGFKMKSPLQMSNFSSTEDYDKQLSQKIKSLFSKKGNQSEAKHLFEEKQQQATSLNRQVWVSLRRNIRANNGMR